MQPIIKSILSAQDFINPADEQVLAFYANTKKLVRHVEFDGYSDPTIWYEIKDLTGAQNGSEHENFFQALTAYNAL